MEEFVEDRNAHGTLCSVAVWQCANETPCSPFVQWHQATHHTDGLTTCRYRVIAQRALNPSVTVLSVDLFGGDDPCATKLGDVVTLDTTADNYEAFLRRTLPPGISVPLPPSRFFAKPHAPRALEHTLRG